MIMRISVLLFSVVTLLTPIQMTAQETRPRSMLVFVNATTAEVREGFAALPDKSAINESNLPPDSEIHFRDQSFLEKYWGHTISIVAVLLIQAALIFVLLHERQKRNNAELKSRHRMTELAHVNRQATAEELSLSIAHELTQPLSAILTNVETAQLILSSPVPDLSEIREILADIKRDDLRASEVIHRMRSFLLRAPFETKNINVNDAVREVFDFLSVQASDQNVAMYLKPSPSPLWVKGDPIQLQQVVLNLIMNSMDAMDAMPYGRMVICRTEMNGTSSAIISISIPAPEFRRKI